MDELPKDAVDPEARIAALEVELEAERRGREAEVRAAVLEGEKRIAELEAKLEAETRLQPLDVEEVTDEIWGSAGLGIRSEARSVALVISKRFGVAAMPTVEDVMEALEFDFDVMADEWGTDVRWLSAGWVTDSLAPLGIKQKEEHND